jgi:hypothetical protein
MSECEKFVAFANPRIHDIEDDLEIWEDLVPKVKLNTGTVSTPVLRICIALI